MPNQDPLVLRRRGYKQFEGTHFWLLIGVLCSPFFLFTVAALLPLDNALIDTLVDGVLKKGDVFAATQFLMPVIVMIIVRFTMRATLMLDNTGIIYISGIPEKYQWIRLDWKYRWGDMSAIFYKKKSMVSPLMSDITINVDNKTLYIKPWQWIDPNDPQDSYSLKSLFTFSNKKLHQQVSEMPVYQFMKKRGLLDQQNNYKDPGDILNSNRKAQIITVVFTTCIIFFVVDVFFGLTEYYVPTTPWHVFFIAGILGVFIAHYFFHKENLRKQDSVLMAILFGIGIGLSSYPLSIHLNQWNDKNGLVSYGYELGENSQWYPIDSNMPVLTFDRQSDYWAQFNKGKQMDFELRQANFGYFQINMTPIYADQKKYYNERFSNEKK